MSIDKLIDELHSIAATWENGWESEYDISAICENAADQLEQLRAENEQLKTQQQLGMYPIVVERHIGGLEEHTCEECGHITIENNG